MVRPRRKHVTWRTIWPIVIAVPVLLVSALIWDHFAGPDSLPAAQVEAALRGNTVHGGWGVDGTSYHQYFGPDGATLVADENAEPREGRWRIEGDGRVCTAIPGEDERCHLVGQMEQGLYWIDAEEEVGYPFNVMSGEQVPARTSAN